MSCCDKPNGYSHYIARGEFLYQLGHYELFKIYQFRHPYIFARMGCVCFFVFVFVRSAKRVFTVRSFRGGSKFCGV